MHYVIYIDVLFVVNFIMDYVILSITAAILPKVTTWTKMPENKAVFVKYLRRIAASLLGSIWAITILWFRKEQIGFLVLTYIIIGPMMLIISTGIMPPKEILKGVGVLYIVTFILAGAIHGIYYYTLVGYFIHNTILGSGKSVTIWMLIMGGIIANALIRWIIAVLVERKSKRNLMCMVVIENNNKKVELPAFYDTGNSLKDPIYGQWVHIVLSDCVKELLDGQNSYHLIPYTSIGSENGVIPVVRMKCLKIINEKEIVTIEKPLFALYAGRFSKNTPYKVILNPNIGNDSKCV